ncbi:MAG: ABC transporter permease [Clostridium sp.]|nr:ABC transporter permease [Clostridium sp.]
MNKGSKKKLVVLLGTCIFTALLFGLFTRYYNDRPKDVLFSFDVQSDSVEQCQVYYDINGDEQWTENNSDKQIYSEVGQNVTLQFNIPENTKNIRINLGDSPAEFKLSDLKFSRSTTYKLSTEEFETLKGNINDSEISVNNGTIEVTTLGTDSYFGLEDIQDIASSVSSKPSYINIIIAILSLVCGFIAANALRETKNSYKLIKLSGENTKLIRSLSKNDFRNKFASSYLGTIWGFISPLITIAVYWFVFSVGFRSGDVGTTPYALWFIAGIVPWFFFQDALPSTSNVFLEYSYLVKKVVFKIEILPSVKIISSLFVHLFFIVFVAVIASIYGYYPDAYSLQFIYYSFAMVVLVYGLSLFTSSILLFFRDLNQIIGIVLNIGFWATPIGWQLTMIPEKYRVIFKLNPMYYIVTGYRDSFIDKIGIWQRPYEAIYFWVFCLLLILIGTKIFNRLKPHFSDVI